MLRRSFLKGLGALFAASAVPAFALSSNSVRIQLPNLNVDPSKQIAIRILCKNGEFKWFVIPVRYETERYADGSYSDTRLILPSERLKYISDIVVDLRTMTYYKNREGNLYKEVLLIDRMGIAAAPVLERDVMFSEINKYARIRIEDPRVRFAKLYENRMT